MPFNPCVPLVICLIFFNLFERDNGCEWATVRYLLVNLFVKIISIARVRIFLLFIFFHCCRLCAPSSSPSQSGQFFFFVFFISCVFYYRSCYLQVCRSTMTTATAAAAATGWRSKTYEKANIKSMFGRKNEREITFKVTCVGVDGWITLISLSSNIHSNINHAPAHRRRYNGLFEERERACALTTKDRVAYVVVSTDRCQHLKKEPYLFSLLLLLLLYIYPPHIYAWASLQPC